MSRRSPRSCKPATCPSSTCSSGLRARLRLSNFLLWQAAYAELMFVDTLWPDFNEAAFGEALDSYAARQRRFGGR